MSNVQFEDSNSNYRRRKPDKDGRLMKFLKRQGLSEDQARNTLATLAIVAFVLSLFFWF
jgi:hypothetical protein